MLTSDNTNPLLRLKASLGTLTDEALLEYVDTLRQARRTPPKPTERSNKTGAPKGGKARSALSKLDKLLQELSPEEAQKLLSSAKESTQ